MEDQNTDLVHNFWIVGMLDLLGQKEAMEDIDFVHKEMTASENEKFEKGVRAVYDATQLLHETIAGWVRLSERTPPPFAGLAPDELAALETTKGHPLKWQRFSDGLVTYTSLADPLEHCPFRALYFLIGGCATAMLRMLANGTPIRGGLALGAGSELRDGELYGPALARAHKLESEIAGYPRIVIDQRAFEYIARVHQSTGGGSRGEAARNLAGLCFQMIQTDVDGHTVVDFLGPGVVQQTGLSPDSPIIAKAKAFVESQYENHKGNKRSKLAFRYASLLNYFEWRLKEMQQHKGQVTI